MVSCQCPKRPPVGDISANCANSDTKEDQTKQSNSTCGRPSSLSVYLRNRKGRFEQGVIVVDRIHECDDVEQSCEESDAHLKSDSEWDIFRRVGYLFGKMTSPRYQSCCADKDGTSYLTQSGVPTAYAPFLRWLESLSRNDMNTSCTKIDGYKLILRPREGISCNPCSLTEVRSSHHMGGIKM